MVKQIKLEKEYQQKCYAGNEPRILVTKDFVENNKLSISVKAARNLIKFSENDFPEFKRNVAVDFLPFKEVKEYYTNEYVQKVESKKEKHHQITDVYEVAQDFLDYMVFAWMKAEDKRALSAGRSIAKLSAMITILNRPDVAEILEDDDLYAPYGKPALVKACKTLGIKYPAYL